MFKGKGHLLLGYLSSQENGSESFDSANPAAENSSSSEAPGTGRSGSGTVKVGLLVRLWKPLLFMVSTGKKAEVQAVGPFELADWEEKFNGNGKNSHSTKSNESGSSSSRSASRDDWEGDAIGHDWRKGASAAYTVGVEVTYLLSSKGIVRRSISE